jgi:hypothetical protein
MRAQTLILSIALTLPLTVQAGQSLTADGLIHPIEATSIQAPAGDRIGLINDGSFDFGECDAGSAWDCTANNSCPWIVDPTGLWGYPAYDGLLAAWLGGYCGHSNHNSFCQEIYIDGYYLHWYWMGYVNDACAKLLVKVDGERVYTHEMRFQDHSYGTWQNTRDTIGGADVSDYYGYGTRNICFEWVPCAVKDLNDNMLIDHITLEYSNGFGKGMHRASASTALTSISMVKSHY